MARPVLACVILAAMMLLHAVSSAARLSLRLHARMPCTCAAQRWLAATLAALLAALLAL